MKRITKAMKQAGGHRYCCDAHKPAETAVRPASEVRA